MRYQHLRFPGGLAKALTFSYDDGCPQDIRFSDILSKYGMKCTFNLNCEEFRGSKALTREQVMESFLDRGHEIAVHGAYHKAPGLVSPVDGIRDVLECRLELEKIYGMIIRGMAYPDSGIRKFANGSSYDKIKNYLTDLGIVYSRTLASDNDEFMLPQDFHAWLPSAHHANPKIDEYIDKFLNIKYPEKGSSAARYPRLFYIWGHSYEFDNNDNWDLIEHICDRLAGKEDIWYATNIEIYEYVHAYDSLVYSADGSMIYNPTLKKIWFERDKVLFSIDSGETLKL